MNPNHHPAPIVWRDETAFQPGKFLRDIIKIDCALGALPRVNVATATARMASFLKGLFANGLGGRCFMRFLKSVRDVADEFILILPRQVPPLTCLALVINYRSLYAR